jgi:hypothetical protein
MLIILNIHLITTLMDSVKEFLVLRFTLCDHICLCCSLCIRKLRGRLLNDLEAFFSPYLLIN